MCFFVKKKEENKMPTHHDYIAPKTTSRDKELLKQFIEENRIEIDDWHYRKGAAYTAQFGIADGWGANMEPGYIRIHQGVDRAGGGSVQHGNKSIDDVVICPFNFDETGFVDYGNKSYGTLIFLTSRKYQFDMRIAHMHPKTGIIPWALKQFKAQKPYQQNWLIGSAGTYGYSTGAHTHTELISHDEACEVFELMLHDKYGDEVWKEYTDEQVVAEYKKRSKYKDFTEGEILEDWVNQKRNRGVFFINKYKSCFYWNNRPFTRYSTNLTIPGL